MTSMPASRSARAMTLAPRSWPSRPGLGDQDADGSGHARAAVYQSMMATGSPTRRRVPVSARAKTPIAPDRPRAIAASRPGERSGVSASRLVTTHASLGRTISSSDVADPELAADPPVLLEGPPFGQVDAARWPAGGRLERRRRTAARETAASAPTSGGAAPDRSRRRDARAAAGPGRSGATPRRPSRRRRAAPRSPSGFLTRIHGPRSVPRTIASRYRAL